VQEIEIELGIGDMVQIGDYCYIVLDIENGEICFRVAPAEDFAFTPSGSPPGK
jgi:hypothetical protein